MLEENKTQSRIDRHNDKGGGQEDFTPEQIVSLLCQDNTEIFTDFNLTVCDLCAGICYILKYILKNRLTHCSSFKDVKNALSTLYGTELYEDNTVEGRENMMTTILESNIKLSDNNIKELQNILETNIVCTDTFQWDYENWKPIQHDIQVELF